MGDNPQPYPPLWLLVMARGRPSQTSLLRAIPSDHLLTPTPGFSLVQGEEVNAFLSCWGHGDNVSNTMRAKKCRDKDLKPRRPARCTSHQKS